MALGLERPGGKYWWAEVSSHIAAALGVPETNVSAFSGYLATQAMTLKKLAVALAGGPSQAGMISPMLHKQLAALDGTQIQQGVIAASMTQVLASISGQELEQGTITTQTLKLLAALAGIEHPLGSIAAGLQQITSTLSGAEQPEGVIADQLWSPQTLVTAIPIESGATATVLPQPVSLINGAQMQQGVMASSLVAVSTSLAAQELEQGTIAASLVKQLSVLAGAEQPQGVISDVLNFAANVIVGGQAQSGVMAASLPKLVAALSAAQIESGSMALSLAKALTAIGGAVAAPNLPTYLGASTSASPDTTTKPKTLIETIPAGTKLAVVWVNDYNTSSTGAGVTATLGGVPMTLTKQLNSSTHPPAVNGYGWLYCFTLANPPTGSGKTLSVSSTNTLFLGALGAAYYGNVGTVGPPLTATIPAGTATMTHAVSSSDPTVLYAQAFASTESTAETFTSYNQSQRAPAGDLLAGSVNNSPLVYGDAVGNGGTLTFTAVRDETVETAGSIILPLSA